MSRLIAVIGELDSPSLSGGFLLFGSGSTAVTIESGVTLEDKVSGFVASDTLDFRGVGYSANLEAVFTVSPTGGKLRVLDANHPTLTLALASSAARRVCSPQTGRPLALL